MNLLLKTLKKYWHYDNFRNGQEEIIRSVLDKNDTLVVMPTGGGKSLCYQLPALVMEGTAIVISPLIALMKDQVDSLQNLKIPATLINSSIPYEEMYLRMEDAIRGRYKLIYIAPERLRSENFLELIKRMKVSFIAVDEAHCISEWGHDFRPSYLDISQRLKKSGEFNFIALTATATPEVRDDIVKQLEFNEYNKYVRGFDRPNLRYITENTSEKTERILEILNETHEGSTIIYCGSRKRAEKITKDLRENKINAEVYHGGMQPLLRKTIQERFIEDETNVIVATNAFGMGIDKPDVRNVIHTDLTSTLEAYYQEAGRAGRDGLESNCYLLYHPADINLQDFFLKTTHPSENDIDEVYQYFLDEYKMNGNTNQIPIDVLDITAETKLSKKAVVNIIYLLEKNNIIVINKASAQGKLKFTASMDRIKEYFEHTSDIRRTVLESLMKNVSRNAFSEEVEIDLTRIKRSTSLKDDVFDRELKSLMYDNIIKYKNANSTSTVSLKYIKANLTESDINFEGLEKRRKYANDKLEKVIHYAETNKCKRNYILDYFKEEDISGTCGKCSGCKTPKRNKITDERNKFLMIKILSAAYLLEGKFSKTAIGDYLSGKITKQIIAFKLNKTDLFGSCRKINEKMLKNEIDTAIRYRYIEIEASQYRPVNITDAGIEYLSQENSLPAKMNKEYAIKKKVERTIKNELYKILFDLRQKLSVKYGIQPRGIISDKILKNVSDAKPLNISQFKVISGINQLFIEKYSGDFLKVINHYHLPNPSILDKDIINKLIDKVPLKIMSKELNISISDMSMQIQNMLEMGANPDLDHLYSADSYYKIISIIKQKPKIPLRTLRKELDLEEEYPILRIMLAKARKNIV